MAPPAPVGPPVPASLRGQELIQTSELPVASGLASEAVAAGPLGRPPWDALVRRPTPSPAPTPGGDGPRRAGPRSRKRSRRDPLDWVPGDAERPPDPEWDEGVPGPIAVPLRVRVRSAAILLAMTTIFGVAAATALLITVVMAVGALNKL